MFLTPETLLKEFGIKAGSHVADLGAGSGAYSFALADMVGPEGKVYAVEVQKDILTRLKNDVLKHHISRIECIWGDIEVPRGTKLRDKLVDVVLLSNVLFQSEDKQGLAREAIRILKPGGRVLLVDWSESFGGMGPSRDHIVSKEDATKLFTDLSCSLDDVSLHGGAHHYALSFTLKK